MRTIVTVRIAWILCLASGVAEARTSDPTDAERARWRTLAERCGSEVAWCANWNEAAKRAKAEDKLVLVVFQNYAPLEIPNTLRSGPFMDPDFVALVQERFVPFELDKKGEAPFRDTRAFGMGPSSFGTDFLFVTAAGEVVAETGLCDPLYIDGFARDVLASRTTATAKPRSVADPLEAAAKCMRRGELELAAQHLERVKSARGHRLRAALERRLKHGDKALEALSAAEASGDSSIELELERAVIEMRMQRYGEAFDGFERVVSKPPAGEAAAQALFWLGTFEVLRDGLDAGTPSWRKLIDAHADSPWAAKAAANLLGEGHFIIGIELLAWPDETLVAAIAKPRLEPSSEAKLAQVRRDALAYLLASQRPDGSWWNPDDGMSIGSNLYTPAETAIAGMALLRIDREDTRAAAGKALERVLDWHDEGRLEPKEGLGATYSIWSRTYALQFLARCKAAHLGTASRVQSAAALIVSSIARNQHTGGGWPYIFLPDDPEGKKYDPSASFLTAAVVIALCDARAQGIEVDAGVIDKAVSFLRAVRLPEGTFRYMPDLDGGEGPHPGAAGRGPACALALQRAGDTDRDLITSALACFFRHRPALAKEWHKELCHTGSDGQGSHYLFFDYFHAAAALRHQPAQDRRRDRATILADVLSARLADGSFQDMPGLGRAYGTAMALLTIDELEAR